MKKTSLQIKQSLKIIRILATSLGQTLDESLMKCSNNIQKIQLFKINKQKLEQHYNH